MSVFRVVFKKEFKSIFRGGFSVLAALLIPLIMFPLMLSVIIKTQEKTINTINEPKIALYINKSDTKVNVDDNNTEFKEQFNYVKNDVLKGVNATYVDVNNDLGHALANEIVNVALYVDSDIKSKVLNGKTNISIFYNPAYESGKLYSEYINSRINEYSKQITEKRLAMLGTSVEANQGLNVKIELMKNNYEGKRVEGIQNTLLLMLVPTLVIGMIAFGSSSVSSELFSIEKERNTLESLLSTSAKRSNILWAKVALCIMFSIISSCLEIVSIVIAYYINKSYFASSTIYFKPSTIALISLAIFSISLLASMLNIAVFVYAKNNKNANAYAGILTIAPMIISYVVMSISPSSVELWQILTPFLGSVFSIKTALIGAINVSHLLISTIISFILASGIMFLVFKRYTNEKIVYEN